MRLSRWQIPGVLATFITCAAYAQVDTSDYKAESSRISDDRKLAIRIEKLESPLTDPRDIPYSDGLQFRSRHLVFGIPKFKDNRYDLKPERAGVSLLAREAFVVAYSEELRCPIWVAQRWSRFDLKDNGRVIDPGSEGTASLDRGWKEDFELPGSAWAGTSYLGSQNGLERGHMAAHSLNRSWGLDGSIWGCLMSNSVPQHHDVNQGRAWRKLEDDIVTIVDGRADFEVVWILSGALFRDTDNPAGEPPRRDIQASASITRGFRVPYATYRIVAWFDKRRQFQARGYVFDQPYTAPRRGELNKSHFSIPDQTRPATEFIRSIDEIEFRAGVDFFPWLRDDIEHAIESAVATDMWGGS